MPLETRCHRRGVKFPQPYNVSKSLKGNRAFFHGGNYRIVDYSFYPLNGHRLKWPLYLRLLANSFLLFIKLFMYINLNIEIILDAPVKNLIAHYTS